MWLRPNICEEVAKFDIFIHGDFFNSSHLLENAFYVSLNERKRWEMSSNFQFNTSAYFKSALLWENERPAT